MANGTNGTSNRPALQRSKTDVGPGRALERTDTQDSPNTEDGDEDWELRHGWDEQYNSQPFLEALHSRFYMYFTDKRHETGGIPIYDMKDIDMEEWRVRSRIKTVFAGLMLCLNIGVDPPDVVKTNPCATLEAWVDTSAVASGSTRIMDQVGKSLQAQYETLSMRIRYKQYLDPSVEETRKCCVNLRRNSKEERVLFHYNGHGVPLPTAGGEIWFFNKNYTQYIPVSLYDLQHWLAGPSIIVLDVSHAGNVVENWSKFIDKHEEENKEMLAKDPNAQVQLYGENIILAACAGTEMLPTRPDLPADLFTACLTTPVTISLRCFLMSSGLDLHVDLKDLAKVPGKLAERRSPLGELNWIFTAITDTIAWNCLPRELFKRLFRQDLMVAALFRNYLLADRLMRQNGAHPLTEPALPETHTHPLWASWDLAIELVLTQLPQLIEAAEGSVPYEYLHSSFFAEQLTAFEIYLSQGALERKPPDQLPVVLQVLLSQVHRLRALMLLGRFLDLGSWAVLLALKIGIFPYVLKLLQSAALELKPVLIFIWTRILAVDQSCQGDLLRDNGYKYFLSALKPDADLRVSNKQEHRAMAAFIIAMFLKDFPQARAVCSSEELFKDCNEHGNDVENPLLRQWSCLLIGMLWKDYPEAKWTGMRVAAHESLCHMVWDPVPEVRAAAVYALTNFLNVGTRTLQLEQTEEALAMTIMTMAADGSPVVRRELLCFFSAFIVRYETKFIVAAFEELLAERDRVQGPVQETGPVRKSALQFGREKGQRRDSNEKQRVSEYTVHATLLKQVLILTLDPVRVIAEEACFVMDYLLAKLLDSSLQTYALEVLDQLTALSKKQHASRPPSPVPSQRFSDFATSPPPLSIRKTESYLSLGLKRTASMATALKNMTLGGNAAPQPSTPPSPGAANEKGSQTLPAQYKPLRGRVPDEWSRPPDAHDPQLSANAPQQSGKAPDPMGYSHLDLKAAKTMPLRSEFFEWSTEYFREPQMKIEEPEEPGSDDYNARLWRITRNDKTLAATQPLKQMAGTSKWDVSRGPVFCGEQPSKMCFHQYESHVVVADDRDSVSVWDYETKQRISRFSNGNPAGSKINEMRLINEDDQALLVTGSSDGVIKIYKNYDEPENIGIVSAFRGLKDTVQSTKNVGLVFEWQQGQGKLLVSGDVNSIRVWNVATELCGQEIPSRTQSCITALTSDQVAGDIFVAGHGNGKVIVYDQRLRAHECMVQRWSSHKQWITNVHMQRGGMRELVSGSRNGEVKLWDIRMKKELRTIQATKNTLRVLSVHEHAPVFATGSDTHHVNFFNVNGNFLNSIEPSGAGFLHSRANPIAAVAFHPHQMMLACSVLNDHSVHFYTCQDRSTGRNGIGQEYRDGDGEWSKRG